MAGEITGVTCHVGVGMDALCSKCRQLFTDDRSLPWFKRLIDWRRHCWNVWQYPPVHPSFLKSPTDDRWFQMSPDVRTVSVCLRDVGVTLGWLTAGPQILRFSPLKLEKSSLLCRDWCASAGPEPARAVRAQQPGLSASSELRAPGLETGAPSLWWLVSDQSARIVTREDIRQCQTSSQASVITAVTPVMSHNHNWSSENTSRGCCLSPPRAKFSPS